MGQEARRDVLQVLIHDHREVEEMFSRWEKGDIGDGRNKRDLVDHITVELVRHSVAEEQHLYPAVRERVPGGDAIADKEIGDHADVEQLLKDLEGIEPADTRFDATLSRLIAAVRGHIQEEESVLFPQLASASSAEDLLDLGDKVAAAKKTAPTRPHPSAPDTPPANRITGPALGLVDRIRDAVGNRATDR